MVYTRLKEKAKGVNEFYTSLETNVTDPMKDQPDVTVTNSSFSEDGILVEDNDKDRTEAVNEYHPSVPPNNTYRADANLESSIRI